MPIRLEDAGDFLEEVRMLSPLPQEAIDSWYDLRQATHGLCEMGQ